MSNVQQPEAGRSRRVPGSTAPTGARPGRPAGHEADLGPVPEENQPGHHPEVEQDKPIGPPPTPVTARRRRYEFEFEPLLRPAALAVGVTPWTARVDVDGQHVDIRFGPWHMRIDRSNIAGARETGPYRFAKVAGPPHLSLADRGITFATTRRGGVCIELREPQGGIGPIGLLKHPAVTVTVADPEGLIEHLGV